MSEGSYDTAQICNNGHVITPAYEDFPNNRKKFCPDCGAATINACPTCSSRIRGHLRGVIYIGDVTAAKICDECGTGYPWTTDALEAANELIEDFELNEADKTSLKASIPDLVRETPKSRVASKRFLQLTGKAGKGAASMLRDLLVDLVSESVRKLLWGP